VVENRVEKLEPKRQTSVNNLKLQDLFCFLEGYKGGCASVSIETREREPGLQPSVKLSHVEGGTSELTFSHEMCLNMLSFVISEGTSKLDFQVVR